MVRAVGGCLRRVVILMLVIGTTAFAWRYRGTLADVWHLVRGGRLDIPASGVAERAEAKLAALKARRAPERVTLTEAEVQSLVRSRAGALLPPSIPAPRIDLERSRVRIHLRVPTQRLARLPDIVDIAGLLPDTTDLTATAQLIPLDATRLALAVDELSAARVPLPNVLIPVVLRRLGREDEPGVPPDAVPVPLPPGAATAYVRGDSLVLLAQPLRARAE